jgi:DNA invertase Pin-like site-specific DNA recombinase
MLVGFVRWSDHDKKSPSLDAQGKRLTAFGVEKVFTSGATLRGPQARQDVAAALGFVREGDCLVVTRPDRIALTPGALLKIADGLTKRGVGFVVLSGFGAPLDTRDRSSEPLLNLLRGIDAWEKACTAELLRAGHARARLVDPSKYVGGKKRVSDGAIRALAGDRMTPAQISRILKISRNTVYTYLPEDYRVPRKPKREPRQPIDARAIQALVAAGVGPTRVAQAIGCSKSSVRRLSRI